MTNLIELQNKAALWDSLLEGLREYKTDIAKNELFEKDEDAMREADEFDEPDVNHEGDFEDISKDTQERLIDEATNTAEEYLEDFIGYECLAQQILTKAIRSA